MVSYSYYIEIYRGSAINDPMEFERLSMRAAEYIEEQTLGRADYCTSDAVKKACCAIAELIGQEELQQDKISESVGSWSVTYSGREDIEKRKYNTLKRYLLPTGLLYRGMR